MAEKDRVTAEIVMTSSVAILFQSGEAGFLISETVAEPAGQFSQEEWN